jgi:hypothetical protein
LRMVEGLGNVGQSAGTSQAKSPMASLRPAPRGAALGVAVLPDAAAVEPVGVTAPALEPEVADPEGAAEVAPVLEQATRRRNNPTQAPSPWLLHAPAKPIRPRHLSSFRGFSTSFQEFSRDGSPNRESDSHSQNRVQLPRYVE